MPLDSVTQWLQHQHKPLPPDELHPADGFPLATLSNPPSSSSLSSATEGRSHSHNNVASLVHPPTPPMDEHATASQARRRSSSLLGHSAGASTSTRKHRRRRPAGIIEGDEGSSSDNDHSDSSGKTDSTNMELDEMGSEDGLEDDEETGLTGKDRRRRRQQKKRNTRLDHRIVEDSKYTKEEERAADKSLIRSILINTLLICLWYMFSISISVYNKWMFKEDKGEGKAENIFPYPLFTTCLHMVVQFTLASTVLFLIPSFRPRHDSLNPHAPARQDPIDEKKPLMTKWFYFTRLGPCGAATGLDIGLGNMSLRFITLTFFTMCKSSALGFVLLFAFLFRLEQPSWRLVIIILIMTVGVVMMVAGEAAFDVLGFILVMSSACSSGFRWSLTQILLLRNPATSNPFSSIFFLAPVMFVSLLVLAIPVEGFAALSEGLHNLFESKGVLFGIGMLLFPGCLAFMMTASEFALLKRTSVVTLSICGIFKEVVTITTANLVFNDPLTPINLSGLIITIGSIAAYNYMKIKKMREDARMKAHLEAVEEYAPVLTNDPDPVRTSISVAAGQSVRNGFLPTGVSGDTPSNDSATRVSPPKRQEDLE